MVLNPKDGKNVLHCMKEYTKIQETYWTRFIFYDIISNGLLDTYVV